MRIFFGKNISVPSLFPVTFEGTFEGTKVQMSNPRGGPCSTSQPWAARHEPKWVTSCYILEFIMPIWRVPICLIPRTEAEIVVPKKKLDLLRNWLANYGRQGEPRIMLIAGPSGSGKTTLVDVLLGLLEPQHGTIFFNGQTLNDSLANWRKQIAYLPQDVFLTDNTLRCNVALGVPESKIDNARLIKSLRKARLVELVSK